jgi:hypothetical protein
MVSVGRSISIGIRLDSSLLQEYTMLWLIWIAIMLAVPSLAGFFVWLRLHREAQIVGNGQVEDVSNHQI